MVQAQEDSAELIREVRESVKDVTEGKAHLQFFCDDACIMRFLRARAMDPKKASIMLSDTLKWCALCNPLNLPRECLQLHHDVIQRQIPFAHFQQEGVVDICHGSWWVLARGGLLDTQLKQTIR